MVKNNVSDLKKPESFMGDPVHDILRKGAQDWWI